ncbi:hypothetical protein OE88DRAFT_1260979 [Heliocybe sulcata]|uniref:Uncharacterized protein n=1 Tax=Heliocybe sulcata TaxID=5364 RepID=A0A5C3NJ02_9AGAM|nr:hypothetical protein OE88DRAFT_1260979 [Heliocybe sulcata]
MATPPLQPATDAEEDVSDIDTLGMSPENPILLNDLDDEPIAEEATEIKPEVRQEEDLQESEDALERKPFMSNIKISTTDGRSELTETLLSGLMFDFGPESSPFIGRGEIIAAPVASTPTRDLLGSPLQLQSPATFNASRRRHDPFGTPECSSLADAGCLSRLHHQDDTLATLREESPSIGKSFAETAYNESITVGNGILPESHVNPRSVEYSWDLSSSLSRCRQRTSSANGSPRYEPYRSSMPTARAADVRYTGHSRRDTGGGAVGTPPTQQQLHMHPMAQGTPSDVGSRSSVASVISVHSVARPAPPTPSKMRALGRTRWAPTFTRRVSELRSPSLSSRSGERRDSGRSSGSGVSSSFLTA